MNKKVKGFLLILCLSIAFILGISIYNYLDSPYYYSSELIAKIQKSDIEDIKKYIEKHNWDINTPDRKKNILFDGLTESSPYTPIEAACYRGDYDILLQNSNIGIRDQI